MDNYERWAMQDAELEAELEARPKCSECEEHIQDDYCYEINGEVICEHCLNAYYRKSVEDII